MGLLNVLGLIFVTLKLVHVIDWSWWYVTAPFWGPFGVVIFVPFVVAIRSAFR